MVHSFIISFPLAIYFTVFCGVPPCNLVDYTHIAGEYVIWNCM